MKKLSILLFLVLIACNNSKSSNAETELVTREVVGELRTVWEVLWGPDNNLWITERFGRISRINPETGDITHLITINDVFEGGERGLMGMDLHPDFENNPFVYVVYNYGSGATGTKIRISRYTYTGTSLTEPLILLDDIRGATVHNGARIKIGKDMKLWFTIGDAGTGSLAQSMENVNGKICRMNLDGSIPEDNPFPGSMIWSYGHRNQQGLVFANDKIYTSEHGTSTDDELNIIQKGRNFGWPHVEGFCTKPAEKVYCDANNVVEPILSLYPDYTLAIAGIDYYNHDLIPEWKNSILVTALKTALVLVAKLDETGENVIESKELFKNQFGRLRDVCVAPDGRVFIATSNQDGRAQSAFRDSMDKIIEIKPSKSSGTNTIKMPDDIKIFPNPSSNNVTFVLTDNTIYQNILITDTFGRTIKNIDISESQFYTWDGICDAGNICAPGIYNVIIRSGINFITSKIVMVR
jgi:aldose sugar dehydrogenase